MILSNRAVPLPPTFSVGELQFALLSNISIEDKLTVPFVYVLLSHETVEHRDPAIRGARSNHALYRQSQRAKPTYNCRASHGQPGSVLF